MPDLRQSRPLVAAGAMALVQSVRIAWLARLPDSQLVQRIPDDGFYYLVLAKNFAAHGRWTFDGVSPSSGFHLLWGYLLAALSAVAPAIRFHDEFLACSLFAMVLMSVATYWIAAAAERLLGEQASWGVAFVLLSAVVLVQGTWLMETPLVLFCAGACLMQLTFAKKSAAPDLALALLLGLAGTLSRSDFGLLPFWMAAAHLVAARFDTPLAKPRIACMQLAGAALGVLLIFGHTHAVSGHYFQSSAEVKLWWSHIQGALTMTALHLAENVYDPFYNLHPPSYPDTRLNFIGYKWRHILFLLVLLGSALQVRKLKKSVPAYLLLAMAAAVTTYVLLYRWDGGLQDWYVGNMALPLCLLTGAAWTALPERGRTPAKLAVCAAVLLSAVLSVRPHNPWQEATYRSGLEIRHHPEWQPLGTWNSGVMSYFGGGGVVNMDGLVNDDLLDYIRSGTLLHYIADRRINYLIESPNIFTGTSAKNSGIADGKLASCVDSSSVLFPDDPLDNAYGMHLKLFHLNSACLSRNRR